MAVQKLKNLFSKIKNKLPKTSKISVVTMLPDGTCPPLDPEIHSRGILLVPGIMSPEDWQNFDLSVPESKSENDLIQELYQEAPYKYSKNNETQKRPVEVNESTRSMKGNNVPDGTNKHVSGCKVTVKSLYNQS